jgi:hypothetical protein
LGKFSRAQNAAQFLREEKGHVFRLFQQDELVALLMLKNILTIS